jgi:hypothetical protein
MKHIKTFKVKPLENEEYYIKRKTKTEDEFLGKLYKIYPYQSMIGSRSFDFIVVAKCTEIMEQARKDSGLFGRFDGYVIYPENRKGEFWSSNEYLENIKFSLESSPNEHDLNPKVHIATEATEEEIEEYELLKNMNNYNL